MTDDMLIDSLDLSGDANLDELALGGGEDADMDEVLAALTAATPVAAVAAVATNTTTETVPTAPTPAEPTVAEIADDSPEPVLEAPDFDPMPAAEGYASELWRTMSSAIPYDDADAYEAAFDLFLEKIDTEVATLQARLQMKAAG